MRLVFLEVMRRTRLEQLRLERDRLASDLDWLARPLVMHLGRHVSVAPPVLLPPDETDERQARVVARVVAAYERAKDEESRRARPSSMWELVEERQRAFVDTLDRGDEAEVGVMLASLLQSDLAWGLAASLPEDAEADPEHPALDPLEVGVTDLLVGFAEAVGAARVTSYQQGPPLERRDLDVDLDALALEIEARTGLDLAALEIGGAFGCRVAGKLVTPDSLRHSYTLHLLRELGAARASTVVEIGGGIGYAAALAHRAGIGNVSIFDLPWVNAIQGYVLTMVLPEGSVRLYDEAEGTVRVQPYWCFDELEPRSVDFVVNTNSLPEVGLEAARTYLTRIGEVLRGAFLSINHEGKLPVGTFGPQNCVRELAEKESALRATTRRRSWLWEGYVEEVFVPTAAGSGVGVTE